MKKLLTLLFAVALGLNLSAQVPDYVPTEGLVGWWPLDGNGADESESENHGTVYGALSASDRWNEENSCMNFLNYGDRIELGEISTSIGAPYNGLTISCWFKGGAAQENNRSGQLVAANYGPGSYQIRLEVVHDIVNGPGNHLKYYWRCPNENDEPVSESEFGTDTWNNYVMVVDPNLEEITIFLNGAEITDLNATYNPANNYFAENNRNWMIGAVYPSVNSMAHQFFGTIDDIGIWNRALTEEEILALYNAPAPAPAPGCTDSTACNFDSEATSDDGSCIPSGCMEPLACNYNAIAECEGEECVYSCCSGPGCCLEGTTWDADLGGCIPTESSCPEDLDFDGVVGVNDLMELLSSFGTMCEEPETGEFTCGEPMNYHGYDYATVQIGDQCWFAENLRTELYQNGDEVPIVEAAAQWSSLTSGARRIYGLGDANCGVEGDTIGYCGQTVECVFALNGYLYNWHTVIDSRSICPSNWHVPNDVELEVLLDEAGNDSPSAISSLKSGVGWSEGNGGSNASGFNALGAGYGGNLGNYSSDGYFTGFWSIDETGPSTDASHLQLDERPYSSTEGSAFLNTNNKRYAHSVRCLKDTE